MGECYIRLREVFPCGETFASFLTITDLSRSHPNPQLSLRTVWATSEALWRILTVGGV